MPEAMKRATRADVARRAGVSETIVSYVINDNRYVDKLKRKLVLEAVQALHYRPNGAARALKGKSSGQILLVCPEGDIESRFIDEATKAADKRGYLLSVCRMPGGEGALSHALSAGCDGVISAFQRDGSLTRAAYEAGVPVVAVVSGDEAPSFPAGVVQSGLYSGAREAVRQLIKSGRRRLLFISCPNPSAKEHHQPLSNENACPILSGFLDELRESQLGCSNENIVYGCKSPEEVLKAVTARISLDGFPADAIFGQDDFMAAVGISAVTALGYRVPEDIAVVGFGGSPFSAHLTPSLATVSPPLSKAAEEAINILGEMINGGAPSSEKLSCRFIKAGSIA